jgi:polyhydroxyalkanoate synthesis regulator phasin
MLDIIKKSLYLGLGVFTLTKEKIETLVDELIKKGQLSQAEKPKIVQDVMERIKQEEEALSTKVKTILTGIISEVGLVTQRDIGELKNRLDELEKKVTQTGT